MHNFHSTAFITHGGKAGQLKILSMDSEGRQQEKPLLKWSLKKHLLKHIIYPCPKTERKRHECALSMRGISVK